MAPLKKKFSNKQRNQIIVLFDLNFIPFRNRRRLKSSKTGFEFAQPISTCSIAIDKNDFMSGGSDVYERNCTTSYPDIYKNGRPSTIRSVYRVSSQTHSAFILWQRGRRLSPVSSHHSTATRHDELSQRLGAMERTYVSRRFPPLVQLLAPLLSLSIADPFA